MGDLPRYRADIQGLRALAVIPVVLFHIGLAPGGFVGVDIFFVISGYLITGILLREMSAGSFSLLGFYRRRARRLFPALIAMLALVAIGAWLLLPPYPFIAFGRRLAATILFVANFKSEPQGYFFTAREAYDLLLHAWSLSVEGQFYLVLPFFLLSVARLAPRRLVVVLGVCALLSLVLDMVLIAHRSPAGFFQAPARAFELLIGALLAAGAVPALTGQKGRDALSVLGVLLVLGSVAAMRGTDFPGLKGLIPCLGAALILHAGSGAPSVAGRWLSYPILTFFGAISYSLYLWHWPLLIFLRYLTLDSATLEMRIGVVLVAIGIAWVSWRFVEQPFIERRVPRRFAWILGGVAVALLAYSALIVATGGVPQRFSPAARAMFANGRDISPLRKHCRTTARDLPYSRNCVLGAPGARPNMAVWSDSFGIELAYALGEQAKPRGRAILQVSATGCPPGVPLPESDGSCEVHNRAMLEGLVADPSVRTVVMIANYPAYLRGRKRADFFGNFDRGALALHAAGKQLVFVDPIPFLPMPGPTAVGLLIHLGRDPAGFGQPLAAFRQSSREMSAHLAALAARTGARRVFPAARFCDAQLCHAWMPRIGMLYYNSEHMSVTGARYLLGAPGWDQQ